MTTQTTVPNMALDVPFEEQFNCCICLDIYTKPATIPCGHTFCLDCIDGFWDTKTKAECPLCKETFRKRPELRINQEVDKLDQYAVNVTLDPDTASGWLVLSPDRKKVSISSKKNYCPLPDSPQRFDSCVCVLGKQSFASGRRYWVVENLEFGKRRSGHNH